MKTKENGFTLLELLIVLAVMLVVSSAAGMSFTSVEKAKLSAACTELQGDLRYAQRMAVIEGQKYYVQFDVQDESYKVYYKLSDGKSKVVKSVAFGNGVKCKEVNATGNLIEYTPMGTTGTPCTIVLETGKYSADITINLGSGRVLIKEIHPKI